MLPLYWRALEPASAPEIVAHRIIWTVVIMVVFMAVTRRVRHVLSLATDRAVLWRLSLAAALIAVNWLLYIYGVNTDQVVETSLGYFINPLVTVFLGVVLLHEQLTRMQWVAVGLGAVAVIVLAIDYGRLPWIALSLAGTFAAYGLLKKDVGRRLVAAESLTIESAVSLVPAIAVLVVLEARGSAEFGHASIGADVLLIAAGVATAIPLLFFAAAARRVPLTTLGLLQYLAPVLQFLMAVLVFHEPMPGSRLAGFALVWLALVLLTADGLHQRSRLRRAPVAPAPA